MADIPHFSLPFRFGSPYAAVSEQDSLDEIADCVYVTLVCPLGFRIELPEFGLPDLTFSTQPIDFEVVRDTIEEWEPRAVVAFSDADLLGIATDALTAVVPVQIQLRTEE